MSENNNIDELAKKISLIKSNVSAINFEGQKEIGQALNEIVDCLSTLSEEMNLIKSEVSTATEICDVLTERVTEIEEYIEEGSCFDNEDGVIAEIECPFCKAEVIIGEEFLSGEEPKVICGACNKEIEILTSSCGCGCEEDDECEEGCDCDCSEDDSCKGNCDCSGEKQ